MKKIALSTLFFATTLSLFAQRVDFDMAGRQSAEVTEPGHTAWAVQKQAAETKTITMENGNTLDITIDCGDVSSGTRILRSNWSKNITQKQSKLVGDAVVVYGYDGDNTPPITSESATINISIKGLSAGSHSILAYHNITDGGMTSWAPIDVLVNGESKLTGVDMSWQATTPSAAAQSYIKFEVAEGETVKISYTSRPEEGKTYSTTGIYINGLVFDRPNPKTTALDPYPTNTDMHAAADNGSLNMTWTPGEITVKNLVYLGTSEDNLQLMAESDKATYTAKGLSTHHVYYWRVDQQDADGNVYEGDVWTFRPRRLAFPGAEGHGRFAIGGRGGVVYHVTSLDDDPGNPQPGTFRYGINKVKGPRTIVFDISGIIYLKARLTCSDPYVTIAGQTAPGQGILFRGSPLGVANDGITRFVRMRRGWHNDDPSDYNRGCDGMGMAGNNHSIIDHCSIGWTIDEAFSSRNAKNISLQRTLISEALNDAHHPNYSPGKCHGFAATIGGDIGSYHHNLLAHNAGRNWSLGGGLDGAGYYAGRADIFNNVVYNWDGRTTDGGVHECNFVGNYYKMGPASDNTFLLTAQLEGLGKGSQAYYVNGNIRENKNGSLTQDKEGVTYQYHKYDTQILDWTVFVSQPFFESFATIDPAQLAFKKVLSDVGANQPVFDNHDIRMIKETLTGTYTYKGSQTGKPGLIDRETDTGGFEEIPVETRPEGYDCDQDGMPDWWENAKGLNPALADNNDDSDGDGYTALEEFLNWMAEAHFNLIAGTESLIDLKALFMGFDNNPRFEYEFPKSYHVSENNGVLSIIAPKDAASLLSINVKVTDDDNLGEMSRLLNFYVSGSTDGINTPVAVGENVEYSIYSIHGTLLRNDNERSSLPAGLYILQTQSGSQVSSFKIMKK